MTTSLASNQPSDFTNIDGSSFHVSNQLESYIVTQYEPCLILWYIKFINNNGDLWDQKELTNVFSCLTVANYICEFHLVNTPQDPVNLPDSVSRVGDFIYMGTSAKYVC